MGKGLCMHKLVMHFLGKKFDRIILYTIHFISPFLLVIKLPKLHVFTNTDENSVGPDQVGSWVCNVFKNNDKPRFSMKVVNIHQLQCTVNSKIHENCCKHKI